jgi:uncharacterized protein (TIGR00266 family)
MANGHWYLARGQQQVGPMELPALAQAVMGEPGRDRTLIYGPGISAWTEARLVPQVASAMRMPAAPSNSAPIPATMPRPGARNADVIDYECFGDDMQYVEVTLDPGEVVIAEPGAMMYMTQGIKMDTVFGDPSAQQQSGFLGKLMTAGKRALTGESFFVTTFSNIAPSGREKIAFAAPFPGKILGLDLNNYGGEMICQKHSFLCAARGIQISIAFQKKLGVGLFGGEGFIMQRLTGNGIALVHAGGTLMHKKLGPGETLRLDTGCLVALTPSVSYDIQFVGGFKNTLFGGEGLFFATLTGPGEIWAQSLPLSRLAGRIYAAAPQTGGRGREEGSILGGIGSLLQGDRD